MTNKYFVQWKSRSDGFARVKRSVTIEATKDTLESITEAIVIFEGGYDLGLTVVKIGDEDL